jgi:cobalt/nickel transport system permease protein
LRSPDPRRARLLIAGWLAATFAASALTDLRVLLAALAASLLLLRRGLLKNLRRVALSVVPVTALLSLLSFAWSWLALKRLPAVSPFAALALRAVLIAFLTFSTLDRVDLFRALAPWPTLSRLLVVTLAQIHALRLLLTESLLGLRSRLVRKPGALDVVRGAGGITAALFTLSARNSRDVSDAMRSRGF